MYLMTTATMQGTANHAAVCVSERYPKMLAEGDHLCLGQVAGPNDQYHNQHQALNLRKITLR